RYDVLVLLREAHLVGPPVFEALTRVAQRPIVFDVDDAVWEPYDSPTYGKFARWLKCVWKTDLIFRWAAAVTAGNQYVASHARKLNSNVTLLPTVVDTSVYRPASPRKTKGPVVVGWIGSHSTVQYLRPLLPVLERLRREVDFRFRVV